MGGGYGQSSYPGKCTLIVTTHNGTEARSEGMVVPVSYVLGVYMHGHKSQLLP